MTAAEHLEVFYDYVDELNVQDEDVGMRLFVQSLVGEPMKSFQSLATTSIHSWVMLEDWFNATWVRRGDNMKLEIGETNLTNENQSENVSQFPETGLVQQEVFPEDGPLFKEGTRTGVRWLEPEGMTSPAFSMLPIDFTNNDEWEELVSEVEEVGTTETWDIDKSTDSDLVVQQVNISNPSVSKDVHPCQVLEDDEQIDMFL